MKGKIWRFEKASRVPVFGILCGMVVGCHVTWWSVDCARDLAEKLMWVWEGQRATIVFMTALETVWHSAMLVTFLVCSMRFWRAKTDVERLGHFVLMAKTSLCIIVAMRLSAVLGMSLGMLLPGYDVPIGVLNGWRAFQLVHLGAFLALIPSLLVLADRIQHGILVSRGLWRRVALVTVVLAGYLCVKAAYDVDWGRYAARQDGRVPDTDQDTEDAGPSPYDTFRLTVDEPGEAVAWKPCQDPSPRVLALCKREKAVRCRMDDAGR